MAGVAGIQVVAGVAAEAGGRIGLAAFGAVGCCAGHAVREDGHAGGGVDQGEAQVAALAVGGTGGAAFAAGLASKAVSAG